MGINQEEKDYRVLQLLRLDAQNLRDRLVDRFKEYMQVFSNKRDRSHFNKVFFSRYYDLSLEELIACSPELAISINAFYTAVEKLKWYLDHTEDMPQTVEDFVKVSVKEIDDIHEELDGLFITDMASFGAFDNEEEVTFDEETSNEIDSVEEIEETNWDNIEAESPVDEDFEMDESVVDDNYMDEEVQLEELPEEDVLTVEEDDLEGTSLPPDMPPPPNIPPPADEGSIFIEEDDSDAITLESLDIPGPADMLKIKK